MGFKSVTIVNPISNEDDQTQKKFSSKLKMILVEFPIRSYNKKKFCTGNAIVTPLNECEALRELRVERVVYKYDRR